MLLVKSNITWGLDPHLTLYIIMICLFISEHTNPQIYHHLHLLLFPWQQVDALWLPRMHGCTEDGVRNIHVWLRVLHM
jgi:hypothetical protein